MDVSKRAPDPTRLETADACDKAKESEAGLVEPGVRRVSMTASRWMLVAGLTVALTASSGRGYAEAAEPTPGAWTGGAALGFLGNTDDRTAFAMNLNVERFLNRSFSVGPLL